MCFGKDCFASGKFLVFRKRQLCSRIECCVLEKIVVFFKRLLCFRTGIELCFTRMGHRSVHFEAAVQSFVAVAWFEWQTSLPQIKVSQINPRKQTSRYFIYLANLFLNQSMKRLFRWKQISPPLKLETLTATFWVPETTKRPRCITVSENGSLIFPSILKGSVDFERIALSSLYGNSKSCVFLSTWNASWYAWYQVEINILLSGFEIKKPRRSERALANITDFNVCDYLFA